MAARNSMPESVTVWAGHIETLTLSGMGTHPLYNNNLVYVELDASTVPPAVSIQQGAYLLRTFHGGWVATWEGASGTYWQHLIDWLPIVLPHWQGNGIGPDYQANYMYTVGVDQSWPADHFEWYLVPGFTLNCKLFYGNVVP